MANAWRARAALPVACCFLLVFCLAQFLAATPIVSGETKCVSRAEAISHEKSEVDSFFYNRVVRAGGLPDNAAACLLYSIWDKFLNNAAAELEGCAEFSEAGGYYLESAEIGAAMFKLNCRQASGLLSGKDHGSHGRNSAAAR